MRSTEDLLAGLVTIRQSPRFEGALELIVRRPAVGQREVLDEAQLDPDNGLVGDNWAARGDFRTRGGPPDPEVQITLMNARAADLVAGSRDRWPLAGDQLYVDLDLSGDHLPPGTRLAIGTAILRVSEEPHTGCRTFLSHFGLDAMKFVNSPIGRALNLRGINTRVVQGGIVRAGDRVTRLA